MKNDSILLYWWFDNNWKTNFGDIVSPIVVEKISGKKVVHASKVVGNRLVAGGSVLNHARSGDSIWGTGSHYAHGTCKQGVNICAIRGPLTKKVLEKSGYNPKKIYGDPAYLLPHLFKTDVEKEYNIGILPHFMDYEDVKQRISVLDVNIIDIMSGVKNVIKEVNKCNYIFSSSLHGIIVGEVYGIPTCWVRFSDKVASKEFKFQDYYFSTGRIVEVVDWKNKINLSEGVAKCKEIDKPLYETERFLMACPVLKKEIKGLADLESEVIE
jgi:pyruvyltransferase